MKETYYFSHDYHARHDFKMMAMQGKHGMAGLGIYWCIIEMLYEEGGHLPAECDRIAFALQAHPDMVASVINDFGLFDTGNGNITSPSVSRRIKEREKRSEKYRGIAERRWGKNANALPTHCDRNAGKERKGKERKQITDRAAALPRPTLDEIKAYCLERCSKVDPERFLAYYEANGWRVGRNPMKDWRAAVRTWEKNGFNNGGPQGNGSTSRIPAPPGKYDHL